MRGSRRDLEETIGADLGDGAHVFRVRATDPAGNQSLVERSFTVDTQAPAVQVDSGPSGNTADSTPTFAFSSADAASFECRVDTTDFSACTSPHTTGALSVGAHSFEVRARDAAGNTGAAASRAFTVIQEPGPEPGDREPPVIAGARLTRVRFRVGPQATPVNIATARGTALRFSLSEAAGVTITIEAELPGRRVGSRCLPLKPRGGRIRKCRRFVRRGALTRRSPAGPSTVAFSGRIGRKPLKAGRYRATLAAVDAAGNRSLPVRLTFAVVTR